MALAAPRPTPWRLSFIQPDGSVVWAAKAASSNESATPDALRKARFKVTDVVEDALAFPSKVAARHALLTWGRVLKPGERAKAVFTDADAAHVPPPPSTSPDLAAGGSRKKEKVVRSALVDLVEAEADLEVTLEEPAASPSPEASDPSDPKPSTFSTRKRW